ncbi:MAG: DNA-binding protein [Winogradskyella sp.]|uniref:HU family DNA-binding protein n=1 Tax=Winogradskyella sp. TaxID=1883156 RepID=UPI0017F1E986|nr:HU family DNA-binding protein [Winogradskyella sp.]MBT8243794.1 DNA-binding protein [Winogradskyella sp.]NNK23402.1 DNA-binding protein [Winogradskyella sp.]
MAINYKSQPRKNPQDLVAPAKYYAAVVPNGSVDFETLAEMISEQSALSTTDCLAALNILEVNIIRELRQGRIVRLGRLGNFQVSISSNGYDSPEAVSADGITKGRVLFRPSVKLKNMLKVLKFARVS